MEHFYFVTCSARCFTQTGGISPLGVFSDAFTGHKMRVHLLTAPGVLFIWAVIHPRTIRAQRCLTLVISNGYRHVQRGREHCVMDYYIQTDMCYLATLTLPPDLQPATPEIDTLDSSFARRFANRLRKRERNEV
jgi:hypothetical protein